MWMRCYQASRPYMTDNRPMSSDILVKIKSLCNRYKIVIAVKCVARKYRRQNSARAEQKMSRSSGHKCRDTHAGTVLRCPLSTGFLNIETYTKPGLDSQSYSLETKGFLGPMNRTRRSARISCLTKRGIRAIVCGFLIRSEGIDMFTQGLLD